jgi:hypothetical protein
MAVLLSYLPCENSTAASLGHVNITVVEKMRLQIQIKQKDRETILEASQNVDAWKRFWDIVTVV